MKRAWVMSLFLSWAAILALGCRPAAAEGDKPAPLPKPGPGMEVATFAGGCFWCMEAAFDVLDGVSSTTSGYTGGSRENPSSRQVSAGLTGHAEAVQVVFDPKKISYEKLLAAFWHNIDPLAENRQFCDGGTQYRSGIYYHDEAQKVLAEKTKTEVEKKLGKKVFTEIRKLGEFYPAEEYHQDFHRKNPRRYEDYRKGSGRDKRLKELWGGSPDAPVQAPGRRATGNLYGAVADEVGEPLPGVTVALTTASGAPQIQVTNAEGHFRFLGLPPGDYKLTSSLEGFSPVARSNITIEPGINTTMEVTLVPAVEEEITVEAD